ncbi:MAG: nucleotide pyrophosphohydrolase [Candidatus Natronoplasma sp.]
MAEINELQKMVKEFRDERNWKRYHTPKDLSLSISIEASELLELFQWKENSLSSVEKERLKEEMADVMIYLLALSETADIDLGEAVKDKLEKNEKKYPAGKQHFGKR